jgi:predicted RNase H-like nuclease (RuvC/YqgF family)
MDQKYSGIFNKKIMQAVSAYCKLNSIEDIDGFIEKCFQSGFNIEKYGLLGKTLNEDEKDLKTGIVGEKQVEIEVIREIRVEVPVEVIKEVEKIVTKIEYISDKSGETELLSKIEQLECEMSKKNEELDELRRNLDVNLDITVTNDKVKMLQTTIQNLNTEIRELKKKNEELNKKLLEQPKQVGEIPARFHGSSNLNDNLYK